MVTITLPRLYCPFPSAVNQHAEALNQHTIEWVRKFNLIPDEAAFQKFCEAKFSDLAARVYPDAEFTELKLLSDWNVWLFIFDDQIDEGGMGKQPERLAIFYVKLVEILKKVDTVHQIEALGFALQDIRQRITQQKPGTFLLNRFIHSVENCLAASVWEATNRSRGITPDTETYIKMRALTSGIPTIFDLIFIALGIEIPPEVLNNPMIQRLSLIANNVVCWANDISSCNKEMRCGDVHNLVLTLRNDHRCTIEEAIQWATELHNKQVHAFIDLETQLPSFGKNIDLQLQQYVSSLRSWVSGSFDWHCTSGRYMSAEVGVLSVK